MKFNEQILATFIGSFTGFILAIVLFYITEKIKNSQTKKSIVNSLIREFQYNIVLIDEWTNTIEKILRQITANDSEVYLYLKYSAFQQLFLKKAIEWGILYDLVNNDDVAKLNEILSHFSFATETYLMTAINSWKSQKLEQKEGLKLFEFQKDKLKTFKSDLQKIMQKVM
jgi:hypothetical protein